MHRTLTCTENLEFYARLRLPISPPEHNANGVTLKKEAPDLYHAILKILGIWDVKDMAVGDENTRGISGGQRRGWSANLRYQMTPAFDAKQLIGVILMDRWVGILGECCKRSPGRAILQRILGEELWRGNA